MTGEDEMEGTSDLCMARVKRAMDTSPDWEVCDWEAWCKLPSRGGGRIGQAMGVSIGSHCLARRECCPRQCESLSSHEEISTSTVNGPLTLHGQGPSFAANRCL